MNTYCIWLEQFPSFNPSPSSSIQVKTRATFFKCLRMSITKNLRRVILEFHKTRTKMGQSLAGAILRFNGMYETRSKENKDQR